MQEVKSADGSTLKRGFVPVRCVPARMAIVVAAMLLLFASDAVAQTSIAQKSRPTTKTASRKNSETSARSSSALDSRLNQLIQKQIETDELRKTASSASSTSVRRSTFRPASTRDSSDADTTDTRSFPPARRDVVERPEPEYSGDSTVPSATQLKPTPNLPPASVSPASDDAQFETEPDSIRQASFTSETSNVVTTEATPIDATEDTISTSVSPAAAPLFLDLRGEVPATSTDPTPGEGHKAEVSVETSPVQVLTRAVAWIVIALCLFSLAALGVRRWQRHRGLLPTSSTRSRVIETLSLGPGRSVSLIEMAGHRALVAFDAGGIKQLVLTPPSFHDEFNEADEALTYEPPPKMKSDGRERKTETGLTHSITQSLTTET